ncbi:methylmalonyl Co-A mutase-associated GTPase MeaB [Haloarcula onubensis]|uniref:Methylmalonyl Co-A mutase-associated GTPase MeaB n=1 Tax=Haloarcula onubensis TaxID=2950539 RepID=A0ABU2FLK6_9EURY|nr:methylmalonyl Co-A mutase-associated GTPase MeaB [Halomicroarcula sp. S3CR25-11]MDS0281615.1 methylmalonyl Co-A mutase-associated GTPase MeaB [Halomicroarcula sp. S3CR25-11]
MSDLVEGLLAGSHSALARVITKIENRSPGYREVVSALHEHTGHAEVIGVTGSPGAGKSTLVDKVAAEYRERGKTVGVIAIDPSSPYSGGAVLGDRIRMASNAGDMDVFFRSMSARGSLGGLSTATTDAVTALDAFGKDYVVVETVGAGQNEVDIVRTADTVAVLVPPGSGDDVQMLKAGILEIGDVFVVNKADLDGADRTVQQLREMLQGRGTAGHHGASGAEMADATPEPPGSDAGTETWDPPIVETVANRGEGVDDFLAALADHGAYLDRTGRREQQARDRFAAEIRTLLREDANRLVAGELDRQGGIEGAVDAVMARQTDPYTVVDEVLAPLRECLDERG